MVAGQYIACCNEDCCRSPNREKIKTIQPRFDNQHHTNKTNGDRRPSPQPTRSGRIIAANAVKIKGTACKTAVT